MKYMKIEFIANREDKDWNHKERNELMDLIINWMENKEASAGGGVTLLNEENLDSES